jgi:hypothetical protein
MMSNVMFGTLRPWFAVGGGKQKMRWYFGREGWPTSSVVGGVPQSEQDQATLIDTLQVYLT